MGIVGEAIRTFKELKKASKMKDRTKARNYLLSKGIKTSKAELRLYGIFVNKKKRKPRGRKHRRR